MTDNIIRPEFITTVDLAPDEILSAAAGKLDITIIVGKNAETGQLYLATSTGNIETVLFWLYLAVARAMHGPIKDLIP